MSELQNGRHHDGAVDDLVVTSGSAAVALNEAHTSADSIELTLDVALYTEDVIFRVCYLFTDRCYVFLQRVDADRVRVRLSQRGDEQSAMASVAGEFANELINQRVRDDVARETARIRELIVAQAFAEAEPEMPASAHPDSR